MSFWIKGNGLTAGADKRIFGECDTTEARANPLYLIGTSNGTADTKAHWLLRQQDASGPGAVRLSWNVMDATTLVISGVGDVTYLGLVASTNVALGSMYGTNTYTVQRKLSLADSTWMTLTNGLPSGGDSTSFTDNTVESSDTAYYCITWP